MLVYTFFLYNISHYPMIVQVAMSIITLNREYYTVARRYEFYGRVARTISHE